MEKEARKKLEQENERIMEDVKECKSLAVEAGYGEKIMSRIYYYR